MILLKVINIEKIIRNIAEISRETTTVQLRYYIGNETKKIIRQQALVLQKNSSQLNTQLQRIVYNRNSNQMRGGIYT